VLVLASVTSVVTDRVTELLGDYGLYAVFLLMLVDAVLPAASELVMVYGGALAAGAFSSGVVLFGHEFESGFGAWLAIVLAGTIGYTIGSVLGWAIGIYGGRPFLERRGRWLHLSPPKLAKAERWFDRWGDWAVFLGRITPVARSFVSIPAGVFRAPLGRYTLLTFIGSTIWCVVFAAIGYAFGARWETFHENFHYVDYAVAAGIVLGVVYLLVRRRRSSTLSRGADPAR
jgi:membrane protein DedA with SNARE-associated domain